MLSKMQLAEMKETVIHEFGHVLGLEHEHQRSDFWDELGRFIDVRKIEKKVGERKFYSQWDAMVISKDSPKSEQYDANSVMHYRQVEITIAT